MERADSLLGGQWHAGHDRDVVAKPCDEIFAELGEELAGGAEIGIVRAVEEHHSQRPMRSGFRQTASAFRCVRTYQSTVLFRP